MTNEEQNMLLGIYSGIMSVFNEESDNDFHIDLNEDLDATTFFTQMIKAGTSVYTVLTEKEVDHLEFLHIASRLIFQDALSRAERGEVVANEGGSHNQDNGNAKDDR